MKKTLLPIMLIALALLLSVGIAAADTVYLNDGGTGDGSSESSPLGSLGDAVKAVERGGKIIITDTYSLNEPFLESEHDGMITITGGKFLFNHAEFSRYFMGGPITFEKITLALGPNNTTKTGMIIARFNEIVMGEGVNSTGFNLWIVGGYQYPLNSGETANTRLDSHITIKSGTYSSVIGFSRGAGTTTFRGTSHITIDGGTIKNVYGASVNGQYSGSTEIVVNGGTITGLFTGGDISRRLNGDAKVTINGGKVNSLTVNNVFGHTDVYYLGGKVENMGKSMHDNIASQVTDGSMALIVRSGLRAAAFIDVFDTATYEDGSKVSAVDDAEIAEYTVLEKKAEKSRATAARIYVSNAGNGDGLTPDTAISDLATAYEMLDGVDGTIVIINTLKLEKNFTEPEHENKIVITSYDGERYFDGGLDFGKSKRFYFSGDTTFENTRFVFDSTLLFVGKYNNMTFGTGLEMPEMSTVSGMTSQVFVVGGYQLASTLTDPVSETANATITVESGHYYAIIGYSRGHGIATTPKGVQTIDFKGGDAYRIYGGPVQANTGDGINLIISGGTVNDAVFVGGDQYFYSHNANVAVSGGKINRLCLQNVIGKTEVNWTGGEITSIEKIYGKNDDGTVNVADYAKGATYTLRYNGVTPTAETLALFDTIDGKAPAASKFAASRTYENQFADVTTAHWFHTYVKTAYEYTLANGTSQTKFSPDGKFTVAQALTAAVNIHKAYYGNTVRAAAAGEAWYVPYVEYCVANGIITKGQFADLNANISRGDMAIVFANILPDSEYAAVRDGSNPDVPDSMACAAAVQKLYRAGIVGGDAGSGNYRPSDAISRAEACVIFTRIAVLDMRAK